MMSVSHNRALPLSRSGFINYAVKQTKNTEQLQKVSTPIPGLKATNINKKSTNVWLLHYTASRVHPVSTFPYLILKVRTKKTTTTRTTLITVKRSTAFCGVRSENRGDENSCVCVCVFGCFLHQSSLEACAPLLKGVLHVTCLCKVPPAGGAVCCRMGARSRGEYWRSMAGRQRGVFSQ